MGWEDPLEEGMATHSSILAQNITTDVGGWWGTDHEAAKSWVPTVGLQRVGVTKHSTKLLIYPKNHLESHAWTMLYTKRKKQKPNPSQKQQQ